MDLLRALSFSRFPTFNRLCAPIIGIEPNCSISTRLPARLGWQKQILRGSLSQGNNQSLIGAKPPAIDSRCFNLPSNFWQSTGGAESSIRVGRIGIYGSIVTLLFICKSKQLKRTMVETNA